MGELTNLGYKYIDEETQEEKIIPRAKVQIEEYTYDTDTLQKKRRLFKMCKDEYGKIDDATINILVDFYLNHPDKMEETNLLDPTYKKFCGLE